MKSEFFAAVATFGVLNTICSILKMLGAFPQCEKKKSKILKFLQWHSLLSVVKRWKFFSCELSSCLQLFHVEAGTDANWKL